MPVQNSTAQKWRLIGKLMSIYCLLSWAVVLLFYFFGNLDLAQYKTTNPIFFYPLRRFVVFFEQAFWGALREETLYRGPIWFLTVAGLNFTAISALRQKWSKWHYFLIGLAIFIPNVYWIKGHHVLPFLVFFAGLGWGWLVYKTGSLWPAIVSHVMANVLIYFGIKLAGLFIKV